MSDHTVLLFELLTVLSLAASRCAPVLVCSSQQQHSVVDTDFTNKLGWSFGVCGVFCLFVWFGFVFVLLVFLFVFVWVFFPPSI